VTTTPSPEPSADEPTTEERLAWMGKNSRRIVIALVAILIAAVVVVFSFSLFGSTSANPGNLATTGIMEMSNSEDGQAILTAEKLLPGESGTGTVSIENIGDADGDFSLSADNLVDDPATPALSQALTLVVVDGSDEVYNGPLGDFDEVDLGTWDSGSTHDFTFTVTFDAASGNDLQGARTTLDFTWAATQSTS